MKKNQNTGVYTLLHIALATALGVYGGIYMISENYAAFGKKELARKTLTHGSIFCLLFAFVFFIFDAQTRVIPDQYYLGALVVTFLGIAFLDQRKLIENYKKTQGTRSIGSVLGITFFGFCTFILLFILMGISFEILKRLV